MSTSVYTLSTECVFILGCRRPFKIKVSVTQGAQKVFTFEKGAVPYAAYVEPSWVTTNFFSFSFHVLGSDKMEPQVNQD